ncbi:gastrula zinc finger protein XlCGF8.2DB-like isoform X2 [Dreissena polymorpha]|uniref:gastrula zinc finger protein XlCGF8.2DB-like isoform X2 n=1 Tax=Dreissena polymorpha TaxID=45954 RepID=UPI002264A138|nr:gastrula zinc finger protein XlCGF8.2DB-like isoform X2 [Dreissena polymorpha]
MGMAFDTSGLGDTTTNLSADQSFNAQTVADVTTNYTYQELLHLSQGSSDCLVCGKTFANRSNMTRHLTLHTGRRPFKCDQCPKEFTQKVHLRSHMVVHMRNELQFL